MAWKFSFPEARNGQRSSVVICRIEGEVQARRAAADLAHHTDETYAVAAIEMDDIELVHLGIREGECRVI